MENHYDEKTGRWVVQAEQEMQRFAAIRAQPRFADLDDLITDDPVRAWTLILALVAATPDDLLGYVGTGPLETFIRAYGNEYIPSFESAAADPRFRRAALGMDIDPSRFPPEVEARFVRAIGNGFTIDPYDAGDSAGLEL